MIVRMKNTFRMLLAAMLLSLFALPGYSWQKSFPEKDYVAYLFTYFTGNSGDEEAVRYAVSMDGYTYWALNDNEPVIDSKVISSTGGVRDPHILRCEDGKTFYMVVTDMVSANGWSSNRAMVLLKSTDLVNWSHSVINIRPGGGKVHGVLVYAAWRWSRCHILCLCQCGVYGFGRRAQAIVSAGEREIVHRWRHCL